MVDGLTAAQRALVNVWTMFAAGFGVLLGIRLAVSGWNPAVAMVGGAILMPLFVRLMLYLILGGSGWLATQLYNPSGSRTPSKSAYSGPESLAVRGRFEEAVNAYELAAAEEPDDPEPWLRIARIERMDLRRPKRAVEALRAARERAEPGSATAQMATREIAELWLRDLNDPPRAMPELARLAAEHPDSSYGKWAAAELTELKQRLAAGEFDRWISTPPAPPPPPPDPA